ncbi:MAG: exostosin family protein [Terriglobales bacterium]
MLIFVTSAYSDPEPIESFLRLASLGKRHRVTANANEADAILFVENSRYHEDAFFSRLKHHPLVQRNRERCFMYNEHDHPWCLLPGLYCSMPQRWFDRKRQRATRYIRLLNPVDTSPCDKPDILFSFLGNSQIPLRRKLLRLENPRAILEDTSSFNAFFANGHTNFHARYADILRRSKFVLCPRGSGTSSIRLFETLRAGRVPIIISNQWVAPDGPDWSSCSLRVRERNISEIAEIVSDAEPRWSEMANAARRAWKDWFSDEVLFDRIGDALTAITKERTTPESLVQRFPSILEWDWRLRRGIQYSRSCLSLSRSVQRRNSLVENQKIVASHVTRVSE